VHRDHGESDLAQVGSADDSGDDNADDTQYQQHDLNQDHRNHAVGRYMRLAGQRLTRNQVFGKQVTAHPTRDRRLSLFYIRWYINGYRSPWTLSDVNPRTRPVHEQIADPERALFPTTDQMTSRQSFPMSVTLFNTKFCPHGFAQTPTGRPHLIFQQRERVSIDLSRGVHKVP
jgi:hypothetical protein